MDGYITAREAANKWNISHRRVNILCSENRIKDVSRHGNMWFIPSDAEKPIDGRKVRNENSNDAKPFLKWAGGKGQLLNTIRKYYPEGLGTTIQKYCEPMVGAGTVLFDILSNYTIDEILINDINHELINTYIVIKDNIDELIPLLQQFEKEHLMCNEESRKEYYYSQRDLYNRIIMNNEPNKVLEAALFIYLNKTCFNGLYRVNKKGTFNVPMGSYKNPTICNYDNLLSVSKKLQKVKIISGDYKMTEEFIDENTFAYFDPPYRPLTKTAEFTSYTKNDFNDQNQIELAEYIHKLDKKGAKILLSNSDPKNESPNDDFFDGLYKNLKISRVKAKRIINSNAKKRGEITELLICNY